jgi:hypothetical protein
MLSPFFVSDEKYCFQVDQDSWFSKKKGYGCTKLTSFDTLKTKTLYLFTQRFVEQIHLSKKSIVISFAKNGQKTPFGSVISQFEPIVFS